MKDLTSFPVMNPTFAVKQIQADGDSAILEIEPLEQGYGHTIGNALRRVLLTSLPGSAITMVHISGVDHEYSTIKGMTEDVVELILNLKQVRVKKITSDEEGKMRLDVKGPLKITAADLKPTAGVEVINSDQYIATLSDKDKLRLEVTVQSGIGYQVAQSEKSMVIGEIPVDALFSPVTKVSYQVEETRVGRRTDFDKIVMKVKTDGSITPLEAVEAAASILHRQFEQIINPILPKIEDKKPVLTPEEAEVLRLTVEELDLPTRIANALRKGGFKTVADLKNTPVQIITKVKNLGEKSVRIIAEALEKKSVVLGEGANET